jgi:hypothetical protein
VTRAWNYSVRGFLGALCCAALATLACIMPPPQSQPPPSRPRWIHKVAHGGTPSTNVDQVALRILLDPKKIALDDREVATAPRGVVQRIDPLLEALKPGSQKAHGSLYSLAVADGVDGAQMKSTLFTAAVSGWPVAQLDVEGPLFVESRVPRLPDESSETDSIVGSLLFIVRRDRVDVWSNKSRPPDPATGKVSGKDDASQQIPSPSQSEPLKSPRKIGTFRPNQFQNGLGSLLAAECKANACNPAILSLSKEAEYSLLRQMLQTWTRSVTETTPLSEPSLLLLGPEPEPIGKVPRFPIGQPSGRLPPEQIQKIVRQNYGRLRMCYEQGLARNPNLQGRVSVRFIIGRDGRVRQVSNGGSDLPDEQVVRCVMRAYYEMLFPEPESGTVTVVYPIMFSPG